MYGDRRLFAGEYVAWSIMVDFTPAVLRGALAYYENNSFPGNTVTTTGLDDGGITLSSFSTKVPQDVINRIKERANELITKLKSGAGAYSNCSIWCNTFLIAFTQTHQMRLYSAVLM